MAGKREQEIIDAYEAWDQDEETVTHLVERVGISRFGNDLLPGVATDAEVWSSATRLIRLVMWILNAAETALGRDRDRFPEDKYRETLQDLAKVLHEADEVGLATEGMIPDEVSQDLDREMARAPMKQRAVMPRRESEPS